MHICCIWKRKALSRILWSLVIGSNSASRLQLPSLFCTLRNLPTLLSFIWHCKGNYQKWRYYEKSMYFKPLSGFLQSSSIFRCRLKAWARKVSAYNRFWYAYKHIPCGYGLWKVCTVPWIRLHTSAAIHATSQLWFGCVSWHATDPGELTDFPESIPTWDMLVGISESIVCTYLPGPGFQTASENRGRLEKAR